MFRSQYEGTDASESPRPGADPAGWPRGTADRERHTVEITCARGDSNPHALGQWNLNPSRLPVPTLARKRRDRTSRRGSLCVSDLPNTGCLVVWRGRSCALPRSSTPAKRLIAAGVNDCAIARQLGIPRPTIQDWRRRPQRRSRLANAGLCTSHDFTELAPPAYAYLLGLYLGDGCISRNRRVWRLRIVLDSKYSAIIDRCCQAIDQLMPGQHASVQKLPKNCVEVGLYSKHWPCLFPQHGPGKKHTRRILLEPWQQALGPPRSSSSG